MRMAERRPNKNALLDSSGSLFSRIKESANRYTILEAMLFKARSAANKDIYCLILDQTA